MRRKFFICALALTLTLSLGASAAALQPVETEPTSSGAKAWSALVFKPLDWLRSLFGAVDNPPVDGPETGLVGQEPSGTPQTNSINPDEPPTEAGAGITPDG